MYLLYYWEMEIQRLEWYVWQGSWPQGGKEIKTHKMTLINIIELIKVYVAAPPPPPPAKKKKEIPKEPLPPAVEDD